MDQTIAFVIDKDATENEQEAATAIRTRRLKNTTHNALE